MLKKVLVVDDSKFSRTNIKKILNELEYNNIYEAVDGLDGLSKFKEIEPYLIITDLEMPNLDGIGMIKKIREDNEDIKIVVVSSVVNSRIIQEALRLRASILKKPIKKEKLAQSIELLNADSFNVGMKR